jgi:hypothetical protein
VAGGAAVAGLGESGDILDVAQLMRPDRLDHVVLRDLEAMAGVAALFLGAHY